MVNRTSSTASIRHRWHERVEHYTPDGAFGRLLIGLPTGPIGLLLLIWGIAVPFAVGLLWLPVAFILAGVGLGATVLSIMMLWPVYLSLIGNIESAKTYAEADTTPSAESDDSVAVVKRQYATGSISEAEFERRLETLLSVDAASGLRSGTVNHRNERDAIRETD